jgi:hypothetical protein
MNTDPAPAVPDPRIKELTTMIISAWVPWDILAMITLVAAFVSPQIWVLPCAVTMIALATVPLVHVLRRIDATGIDHRTAAPLRRLIWSLAAGIYLFALVVLIVR